MEFPTFFELLPQTNKQRNNRCWLQVKHRAKPPEEKEGGGWSSTPLPFTSGHPEIPVPRLELVGDHMLTGEPLGNAGQKCTCTGGCGASTWEPSRQDADTAVSEKAPARTPCLSGGGGETSQLACLFGMICWALRLGRFMQLAKRRWIRRLFGLWSCCSMFCWGSNWTYDTFRGKHGKETSGKQFADIGLQNPFMSGGPTKGRSRLLITKWRALIILRRGTNIVESGDAWHTRTRSAAVAWSTHSWRCCTADWRRWGSCDPNWLKMGSKLGAEGQILGMMQYPNFQEITISCNSVQQINMHRAMRRYFVEQILGDWEVSACI